MNETEHRHLRCREITEGGFSGEKVCCINVYDNDHQVVAYPAAPLNYIDMASLTVQVGVSRIHDNKADILFPHAGAGDFDRFTVPLEDLC